MTTRLIFALAVVTNAAPAMAQFSGWTGATTISRAGHRGGPQRRVEDSPRYKELAAKVEVAKGRWESAQAAVSPGGLKQMEGIPMSMGALGRMFQNVGATEAEYNKAVAALDAYVRTYAMWQDRRR